MSRKRHLCVYGVAGVLISLLVNGAGARAADPAVEPARRTTVLLAAQEPDGHEQPTGAKLLARELLRQAVLIAARDQLGLPTRDMALREATPVGEADTLLVTARTTEGNQQTVKLVLSIGSGDAAKSIFEKEIPIPSNGREAFNYVGLAGIVEELSRSQLVDALRSAGCDGRPNPADPAVKPTAATAGRLNEMNFLSQFAALRELHELERSSGESVHTLAALVRAYANLGELTSFHWNAAHKTFRARSLLYAERLLNLDKKGPFSLRHRAYAQALAGLHWGALEDLKAARTQSSDGKPAADLTDTPWEPLIDKMCRYDFAALQQQPPPAELRELGALVAYKVVENSTCENQTLVTGRDVLAITPESYLVCDSMCRYSGVSNRHMTTVHGPVTMLETLAKRLQGMSSLPDATAKALQAQAGQKFDGSVDPAWAAGPDRIALIESLLDAGEVAKDQLEPSWQALGRLIEDVTFVHIYRRLEFFQNGLGLPRDSYADQFRLAVEAMAKHPLLPVIKCAVLESRRDAPQIKAECANLQMIDAEWPCVPFVSRIYGINPSQGIWSATLRHADDLTPELERVSEAIKDAKLAHRTMAVSPHSPQMIALLMTYDQAYAQPRLEEWEKEFSQHGVVLKALANTYVRLQRPADATRCLERYIEFSPDQWGFNALANLYWEQKDTAKWKETLEQSLEQEDFALSHASTRVKLARYHMGRKEWDQAVTYADDAAATGAAWAMTCASQCHEALEQWDVSEQLMRATAARYADQQMDWYFWCRRTGHGDANAAQALGMQRVRALSKAINVNDLDHIGAFHILADDPQAAHTVFKAAFDKQTGAYSGIHLALLADELGDTAERDATLGKLAARVMFTDKSKVETVVQPLLDLSKWLAKAYQQPADAELDTAALDEILKTDQKQAEVNMTYFLGRFYNNRKQPDLARKYLEQCTSSGASNIWNCTMANALLRDLPAAPEKPADAQN